MFTLIFLDGRTLRERIFETFLQQCTKYIIRSQNEIEDCYDWIIKQAILENRSFKIQGHFSIQAHYKHDVFYCVYDELKILLGNLINELFESNKINLSLHGRVKILITDFEIIIFQRLNNQVYY